MLDGPKSTILVVAVAAVFGGFLAVLVTGTAFDQMAWCIGADDHCLRDWVGALSGWAAAFAAAMTILALIRQIAIARETMAAMRGRELRIENAAIRAVRDWATTMRTECRNILRSEPKVGMVQAQLIQPSWTEKLFEAYAKEVPYDLLLHARAAEGAISKYNVAMGGGEPRGINTQAEFMHAKANDVDWTITELLKEAEQQLAWNQQEGRRLAHHAALPSIQVEPSGSR